MHIHFLVTPQHEERERKRFQNGGFHDQVEFWLSYLQRTALELENHFLNVQGLSGDGYHLSVVTGIRFCGTKIQTL